MKRTSHLAGQSRGRQWALGIFTVSAFWTLAAVSLAGAPSLNEAALSRIRFDQKLGDAISLGLPFRDETGQPVRLKDYFDGKPVILVLGYYGCPMLCTLTLNGLVESMEDLKWRVGGEFDILNISIDPHETPALAADKKRAYVKRYGRAGAEAGWHFLTGEDAAIRQLAQQVGFHYAYDPEARQFAHPSGLVVLTPQGRIAHYLFGVTFAPKELSAALRDASGNQVGSPIQQLILLCFHYNPLQGKYSALIMRVVRWGGVATLFALLALVVTLARRTRAPGPEAPARPLPPTPEPVGADRHTSSSP